MTSKWKRLVLPPKTESEHPSLWIQRIRDSIVTSVVYADTDPHHLSLDDEICSVNKFSQNVKLNLAIIESAPEAIALLRSVAKLDSDNGIISEVYEFIRKIDQKIKDEAVN